MFASRPNLLSIIAGHEFWRRSDVQKLVLRLHLREERLKLLAKAIAVDSEKKADERSGSASSENTSGGGKPAAKRKWPDIDHSREVER